MRSLSNQSIVITEPLRPSPAIHATNMLEDRNYAGCVEWLSFPGACAREDSVVSAYPETFEWILDDERFRRWIQDDAGIFWIQGKPGSGKSTIIKYLSRIVEGKHPYPLHSPFTVCVSVFLNGRGSILERSIEGFLRLALVQILQQQPDHFERIRDHYIRAEKRFSESLLTDMLKVVVENVTDSGGVCFLIDALDELDDPPRRLVQLLESLIEVSRMHNNPARICVSGRPVHRIAPWLNNYLQLTLEDHTSSDISTYVMAKTSRLVTDDDAEVYMAFQLDILEKAKGVFLWVTLVIEELLDGWEASDPVAGLRKRLASLPEEIEDFFSRMLQRIPETQISETVRIFHCVLGARRSLTLREFRCALAFGSDTSYDSIAGMAGSDAVVRTDQGLERRIQLCCGGLVELSKPSNTIQFIHQTVLDFLLQPGCLKVLRLNQSEIVPWQCHQYLLRACIQYLSSPELKTIPVFREKVVWRGSNEKPPNQLFDEFDFLSYSLENWVDHYVGAEQGGHSQSAQVKDFGEAANEHFLTWYRLYCQSYDHSWDGTCPSFISFAAEHNLFGYVKDCLNSSSLNNSDEVEYTGPLQAAVMGENVDMVRLLLDHGVDVNEQGGRFGTAIAAAITFGKHDMVKLLRQYGADVELHSPGSPLIRGSKWTGHRNPFSRAKALQAINAQDGSNSKSIGKRPASRFLFPPPDPSRRPKPSGGSDFRLFQDNTLSWDSD